MNRRPGYSKEVRERSVRLVLTREHDHSSRWAATQSVASKIGCSPETLGSWNKELEVDSGTKPGVSSDPAQLTKELERENRELKRANEILRKAAAFNDKSEAHLRETLKHEDTKKSGIGVVSKTTMIISITNHWFC